MNDLKTAIQEKIGVPIYRQYLTYYGHPLDGNLKLYEHNVPDSATVILRENQAVRKPVIYLFSPWPIRSIVRVSLVRALSFSAVYPDVPVKDSEFGQSIEWDVDTHGDHTLTTTTGTRVSYLFWEAELNGRLSPSPPPSPRNTIIPFDPSSPQITHENSVVLRTSQAAVYLDKARSTFGLHVEARTSFITYCRYPYRILTSYWLPSILKHDYVALHFLPQASYEYATPLNVEPKPDIITRVFMLFTKVCEDELVEWEGALTRAFENVNCWKAIIGVNSDKMRDQGLFRVLEWGGMEVAR
ncbi:hypothetical protein DFS33DRAFT_1266706 [Desarmillaria ectypa]|nr:hypothetical protein DFS33DRAFT_1266706 [Desarmillaria ectypa]